MFTKVTRPLFGLLLAVVLFAACTEPTPTEPLARQATAAVIPTPQPNVWSCYDPVDPHCLPVPPDPHPSAPGVYLANTEAGWAEVSQGNDVDLDGLDDLCEYQLAYNFRPLMRSQVTDDTRGEPYWAVQPVGDKFHIIYALAYYWDWGTSGSACSALTQASTFLHWFGIPKENYCAPHEGDSEFIVAEVDFDAATDHWYLVRAYLSSHWGSGGSATKWVNGSSFTYPAHEGWYPLIFVARGKHANYESKSRCEETVAVIGPLLTYQRDNCSYTTIHESRVAVTSLTNLGSRIRPASDVPSGSQGNIHTCVVSQGAFVGNGLQECFWRTGFGFGGWQPYNRVTGYGEVLTATGF